MNDVVSSPPAPKAAAEYRVAIAGLLAEIESLNEQMARDRAEIDRLKAETELIKAETEVIKHRAQERLDALTPAA